MWIGRYRIFFGRFQWLQTQVPVTITPFLCFTIVKKARPADVDKAQRFLPGTPMFYKGKLYRYWRGKKTLKKGQCVVEDDLYH